VAAQVNNHTVDAEFYNKRASNLCASSLRSYTASKGQRPPTRNGSGEERLGRNFFAKSPSGEPAHRDCEKGISPVCRSYEGRIEGVPAGTD
jgi:hypothetical protein